MTALNIRRMVKVLQGSYSPQHIDLIDIIIKYGSEIIQGHSGNLKMAGHVKHFIMDNNNLLKSDTGFKRLRNEELFDTYGGRIFSWGATSGYVFLTSLVRDLLKKEEEK